MLQARTTADLTNIASGAWVSGSTSLSPSYPSGTAEGDVVYLIVHNKPNTVTPSTPANFSQVLTVAGGGGSQGDGTGQTRITVFRRVAPSGGLAGTQAVTITSGNASRACMVKFRASGTNLTYSEAFSSWSNSSASTAIGGTTAAAINLRTRDQLLFICSVPDDSGTGIDVTSATSTGSVLTTPAVQVAYGETTTGNDLSGAVERSEVIGGAGNATVVAAATYAGGVSETSQGVVLRVRALVDVLTPRTTERAAAFLSMF
jgi:hypothetical protein